MRKLLWIFSVPLIILVAISISALGISGCGKEVVVACNISSVAPTTGCPGEAVTISGSNFGATAGSVSLNSVTATIISWNNTSIVVSAPCGDYSNMRVTPMVGNPCGLADSYSYDNVGPTPPTISSPTTGQCFITTNIPTSISCDEGTCEERIDSGAWQPCNTGFTTSPGEESHTVDARCIDACENISSVSSVTFPKDTVPAFCGFAIWTDCPEKRVYSVGEEFMCGVNVCFPERNLMVYDMRIIYDPSVINLVKASGGDADEFSRVMINIKNTPDPASGLAISLFNGVNNGTTLFNSPSGPKINVAKITFKAVGKGGSILFLRSVGLWDTNLKPVSPKGCGDEWVKVE